MSAIYGVFGAPSQHDVTPMGQRLRHRGSMAQEWSPAHEVLFGYRSSSKDSEDSWVAIPIAFDGFLDNREELASLYEGMPPGNESRDDPAAALQVYRILGPDGFSALSGQFALALWDERKHRLVLARDRFGTRPLFFSKPGSRLLFASEYKALLAVPEVPATANREALQFLHRTHLVPGDQTLLKDIFPVPQGHWIGFDRSGRRQNRFWSVSVNPEERSPEDHASALQDTILDTARRQCERYEAVGVSLSGGLDSALAVAAIRRVWPGKKIFTFSAGYGAEDLELRQAAEVAEHFKTEHHEIVLEPDELLELVEPIVWYLEDPVGREETAFLLVTSRYASQYVSVLMSGYGADALFGGMPRHLLVNAAFRFPPLRRPVSEFHGYTQTGASPRTWMGRLLHSVYYRGSEYPYPEIADANLELPTPPLRPVGDQPLTRYLLEGLYRESLEGKVERLHACCGLAFNSPCMDTKMIDLASTIPDRQKIRGRTQKYILRRACEGLLPPAVLKRGKTLQKLRHDLELSRVLDVLADRYLKSDGLASRGIFDRQYLEGILKRPTVQAYSSERAFRLWSILLTEVWCRQFLDHRGRPLGPSVNRQPPPAGGGEPRRQR